MLKEGHKNEKYKLEQEFDSQIKILNTKIA